jgi:ATP-dependent Lhr-like helicase
MMWGRLRCPKREEDDGPSRAAMTRTVPISLAFRDDLGWILPAERIAAQDAKGVGDRLFPKLRGGAQQVFEALQARGALFFPELARLTGLLPTQLEDAVRELAALGLITSDALAAVRAIVAGAKEQRRRDRWRDSPRRAAAGGRWSLFPGMVDAPPRADSLDRWCRLLMARYGVLFRDLLTRESAAPAWYELVPVLRRLERRGEIRGGRFVTGVAGEQYASEEAVQRLREVREDQADEPWVLVSAADPLNLVGIVTPGEKVPATHKNVLVLYRGKCVATRIAKEIAFVEELSLELRTDIERALRWGPHRADGKHRRKRRGEDGSLGVA